MKRKFIIALIFSVAACLLVFTLLNINACNNPPKQEEDSTKIPKPPDTISYSVGPSYPHDTSSFTEGLLFYKGELYESTGDPDYSGKSRLMKVDLSTGAPKESISLDKKYFGEGMVILNDTVYQLTYQEKVGFMYALTSKGFKKLGEFSFASNEGWGMTTDGKEIIATDGTSNLYYYQPGTFKLLRTQSVTEAGSLSYNLNELEYINGYIYANQWQAPYILKIEPSSGQIVGKIDFTNLNNEVKSTYPYANEFNGIAYDTATKKLYVTGKNWPKLYEITLGQ
jgi:glutamine cyclotransferase